MKLSVVGTLYKSSSNVREFVERVTAVSTLVVGEDFEIVLVVDGCEESLVAARQLVSTHANLMVVDLSRNFGHHRAMMTGLEHSSGDHVFLIDTDLEEMPEWLERFWYEVHQSDLDVVYGFQERRRGNVFRAWFGEVFYKGFAKFSGISVRNQVTARLMSRRYVNALLSHRESEIIIGGLWSITGFAQASLPITKLRKSETTYSPSRRLSLAIESIVAFSNAPLVLSFYLACLVFVTAVVFIIYLLGIYLSSGSAVEGYLSIIASVWLLSGIILLVQGIQNFYIAVIFSESKDRPRSIVREVYVKKSAI